MVATWHSIGRLTLDMDGHLWESYRRGFIWHGPIEAADPPPRLAEDAAQLLEMWRDAFDPKWEQLYPWE